MARIVLSAFAITVLGLGWTAAGLQAGDTALAKELDELNALTGSKVPLVRAKAIIENKDHAKKLLAFALPAAKNKQISYNGALALGLIAIELKDSQNAETFLRVCMERAAKLQSPALLKHSYGLLIKHYYDNREYADAARLCRELLDLNTNDGIERLVIGTVADPSGAVEFSEPRESFAPTQSFRAEIFRTYVKATVNKGDIDSALAAVDYVVNQKEDWLDHELKGWVLLEAGRPQDAARDYEQVVEQIAKDNRLTKQQKDVYSAHFRYLLSSVYADLQQTDKATDLLQTLIKSKPDEPAYYNALGFIWADHNLRLDEAEKLVEKALELDRARRKQRKTPAAEDRDNGHFLDSLGWVYYRQKNFKEAKEVLLKATADKNAHSLSTFDHLGDAYLALGDVTEAAKAWRTALELVEDTRRGRERKIVVEKKLAKANGAK